MDQIIAANGYPTMAARYWLESEENPSRRTGERAREKGKKHRYVRCFSLRKFQQKKRKHHIIDETENKAAGVTTTTTTTTTRTRTRPSAATRRRTRTRRTSTNVWQNVYKLRYEKNIALCSPPARAQEHVNNTKAHTTITLMASPVCEALQYGYNMGYNGDIINTVYRIWVCLKMGHSLKWQFQIGIVTINSALVIRRTSVSGISWLAFRCHLLSGWGSYGHHMAPSCTITSLTWKKRHQHEADGGFPRSLSKTRWTFFKNRGCLWGCR